MVSLSHNWLLWELKRNSFEAPHNPSALTQQTSVIPKLLLVDLPNWTVSSTLTLHHKQISLAMLGGRVNMLLRQDFQVVEAN